MFKAKTNHSNGATIRRILKFLFMRALTCKVSGIVCKKWRKRDWNHQVDAENPIEIHSISMSRASCEAKCLFEVATLSSRLFISRPDCQRPLQRRPGSMMDWQTDWLAGQWESIQHNVPAVKQFSVIWNVSSIWLPRGSCMYLYVYVCIVYVSNAYMYVSVCICMYLYVSILCQWLRNNH
jgi:hypothetical protein